VTTKRGGRPKGRPLPEEHKQNIAAGLQGRNLSERHRLHIAEGMRGKAKTPEHRAAISAAKRAAFEQRILADAQLLYETAMRLGKETVVPAELQEETGLSFERLFSVAKRLRRARETGKTLVEVLEAEQRQVRRVDQQREDGA
jgi:hypothetical protein